ncbi:MAG TPA: anthranilate synthase component I family protein [Dissulfurispiraceae bacterium]|nr:anthranilate synthase component I family protein [Dissulfurispiraceae bacterium]
MINLTKRTFLDKVRKGLIPTLYREVDYADPFIVYRSLVKRKHTIFLDSAKGTPKIARYSFIAADPYLIFRIKDGEIELDECCSGRRTVSSRTPTERLSELLMSYPQMPEDGLPPFQGGAVGLLSYDFVRYIEKIPAKSVDDLQIPDAHFLFFDRLMAFDHVLKKAWIIFAPGARSTGLGYVDIQDIDWGAAYDEAESELARSCGFSEIETQASMGDLNRGAHIKISSVSHEMSKDNYMEIVSRAKEYIAAGDIFQANLSQRISAVIGDADPLIIYEVLRKVNPSPFAAYADFGEYQIASSSPERLIEMRNSVIETRPIAGTRPRGRDGFEDSMMRSELLLNEKERAEHIMLIDLERNDLGRVSQYGSVKVDEFMITEDYSHVIHIVSNVLGIARQGVSCLDVIKAVFPGGTITGVPKVRCMEIIDELEPVRRGPYTGSLGYFGFSGNMDFNIIIRTFVIKGGCVYIQVGAGIVADSDPEREYFETLKKAEALLKTLGEFVIQPV